MPTITPVLMSGGAGTRLWPLSRRARPALILEPEGRNTGPAAVVSAALAEQEGCELVLLLSADARVKDPAALRAAIAAGAPAAEAGALVVFGITPTAPATGYGYIRAGAGEGAIRKVAEFVEKPDLATARRYVADPAYSWNAGIFLFRADAFLQEAARVAPDLAAAAKAALAEAPRKGDTIRLGEAFRRAPAMPVDVAVFEKTDKAVVVAADIGWSDVGAYDALWIEAEKTASGDALQGPVIAADTANCLAVSDGPTVVLAGVENLAVIVEAGVVLVTRRDAPGAVRAAVEAVKNAGREDLL